MPYHWIDAAAPEFPRDVSFSVEAILFDGVRELQRVRVLTGKVQNRKEDGVGEPVPHVYVEFSCESRGWCPLHRMFAKVQGRTLPVMVK